MRASYGWPGCAVLLVACSAPPAALVVQAPPATAPAPPITRVPAAPIATPPATSSSAVVAAPPPAPTIGSLRVPSSAMFPGFEVGDSVPVADTAFPPRRGDVLVFAYPMRPDATIMLRVVALPGEELRVEGGRPKIDGWLVPRCSVGRASYTDNEHVRHEGEVFVEFLGAHQYLVFMDDKPFDEGPAPSNGPWRARDDEVWALGDNRNQAFDSRFWFGGQGGGVPRKNVRGGVVVRDEVIARLPERWSALREPLSRCLTAQRDHPVPTEPPRDRPSR